MLSWTIRYIILSNRTDIDILHFGYKMSFVHPVTEHSDFCSGSFWFPLFFMICRSLFIIRFPEYEYNYAIC